jgi:hypothetical protein
MSVTIGFETQAQFSQRLINLVGTGKRDRSKALEAIVSGMEADAAAVP